MTRFARILSRASFFVAVVILAHTVAAIVSAISGDVAGYVFAGAVICYCIGSLVADDRDAP